MTIPRPGAGEFGPFFAGYIEEAGSIDVLEQLDQQVERFEALGRLLDEPTALRRYAPGKWSVKEIIGHMSDGERIFAYRALRASRGDTTPLPGFDENAFVDAAGFDRRPTADLVAELVATRRATLALFRGLDAEALARVGNANGYPLTARATAWIIAGHTKHHLDVLAERYGVTA